MTLVDIPFYPTVEETLKSFARTNKITWMATVNRALQVLGYVDALMTAGETVFYFPDLRAQMLVAPLRRGTPLLEEVNLNDLNTHITRQKPKSQRVALLDSSHQSLTAYVATQKVNDAVAMMRGAYLLVLASHLYTRAGKGNLDALSINFH